MEPILVTLSLLCICFLSSGPLLHYSLLIVRGYMPDDKDLAPDCRLRTLCSVPPPGDHQLGIASHNSGMQGPWELREQ